MNKVIVKIIFLHPTSPKDRWAGTTPPGNHLTLHPISHTAPVYDFSGKLSNQRHCIRSRDGIQKILKSSTASDSIHAIIVPVTSEIKANLDNGPQVGYLFLVLQARKVSSADWSDHSQQICIDFQWCSVRKIATGFPHFRDKKFKDFFL